MISRNVLVASLCKSPSPKGTFAGVVSPSPYALVKKEGPDRVIIDHSFRVCDQKKEPLYLLGIGTVTKSEGSLKT